MRRYNRTSKTAHLSAKQAHLNTPKLIERGPSCSDLFSLAAHPQIPVLTLEPKASLGTLKAVKNARAWPQREIKDYPKNGHRQTRE